MTYTHPLPEDYADRYAREFPDELDITTATAVRWFGAPWPSAAEPAPICRPDTHTATPVGWWCVRCGEAISQSDKGIVIPYLFQAHQPQVAVYGLECFLASIGLSPTLPWLRQRS